MASKGISMTKSEDDWQADCDLRTLQEAEAIKKDPKRMKRAAALAKKKLIDLAAVAAEADEKS